MIDVNQIAEKATVLTPMQSGEHIQAMEYMLEHLDSRENGFIEIGSAYGGSFFCWASLINGPAISIDLPSIIGVPPDKQEFRNNFWKESFGSRVHIVESNSMDTGRTHEALDNILPNNQVDFLFIDGNHSYEPTYNDFYNYKKYVRKGGLVAFHDIYHHAHLTGCAKVFEEAEGKKYKTDPSFGWAGIGIIHV
jgi:predicted O-methyltransferase YrrM